MLEVRKARPKDKEACLAILKDHDLYYSALEFKGFWVADQDGRIAGCAQLEEYPKFQYLGSVAVDLESTQRGIARRILDTILKDLKKDVYLYTIIPDFFKKFGFSVTEPMPDLPSKERYECFDCFPEKCVCMVKRAKG
jgi:N-acetylglutamate synthase-like GNAT family acetyltransferase